MYKTTNELFNFDFSEAYIDDMRMNLDSFYLELENVKILPENSCNRDIRLMRTNDLTIKLPQAKIVKIIEEGFKRFDADGKLMETVDDIVINEEAYMEKFKEFVGSTIYSLEKKDEGYLVVVDGPEHIYDVEVSAVEDIEEWKRFINV